MNWHSPRLLLSLLIVCVVVIAGILFAANLIRSSQPNSQHPISRASVPPLPTPGSERTAYTNAQFGYTITYPTQWYLKPLDNNSLVRVFLKYDLSVPEAIAFEIRCYANPNQFDAKTFWQQQQPPSGGEVPIGTVIFSSGINAYAATGQGQVPYKLYTLTKQQTACQITALQTDPLNTRIVLDVVKSFRW